MTRALLGCIADDFTGATDLANNLVRAGMRVVQAMGVPTAPLDTEADAIVVALKSRTIPKDEAIAQSLEALKWLQAQGAEQIYFKYCSTFDSTAAGNSWMFENRMAHVLAGDYTPLSAVDIFVKDLGLVLDTARASKFPLPLAATAHQMFMQASTAGFAKEDDSAVIKIFPGITLPEAKEKKA